MNKEQIATVSVFAALLFLAILMAYFLQDQNRPSDGSWGGAAFRAKPGTEREHAVPFVTEQAFSAPQEVAPSERETALRRHARETLEEETLSEQILRRARSVLAPEQAISELEARITERPELAEEASVQAAMGELYLKADGEAAVAEAEAAFARALNRAEDARARGRILGEGANALWEAGRRPEAIAWLEEGVEAEPLPAGASTPLRVLLGRFYEQEGALDEAEAAYRAAVEAVTADSGPISGDLEGSYRQACLSLARLYRGQDREDAAAAIADAMRARLGGP